ncbi:MAG: hypothetical protein JRF40_06975 [Deltaproteobacteria bacterium]|nr:hypothetical protein [Deltaproteobacteria bacterium]
MNRSKIQTYSETTLLLVFMIVIFVPFIATVFASKSDISDIEKRKLASMPKLSLSKESLEQFPSGFEAYYNDHFGFRRTHLQLHSYIKAKMLKSSPVSKVLIGKDNWLYITRLNQIEDFQGLRKPEPIQLEAWKVHFQNKRDWLAERGIQYLYVIAPNKQTIYPEHMPYYINKMRGKTQLDHLLGYLDGEFSDDILDLRQPLLDAKKKEQVYYRCDTHWNLKGSYIAYKNILARISTWFPNEKTLAPAPVNETTKISKRLDLANMLGLPESYRETAPLVTLKEECSTVQEDIDLPQIGRIENAMPFARECSKAKLRAVVFRDSFFASVVPYFSENFKQVVYVWHPYDQGTMEQLVGQIKPDIVIEQAGEGFLFFPYKPEFCSSLLGKDVAVE